MRIEESLSPGGEALEAPVDKEDEALGFWA